MNRGRKLARRALKSMGVNIEEIQNNQEFIDAVNSVDPLQFLCHAYAQIQRAIIALFKYDETQRNFKRVAG